MTFDENRDHPVQSRRPRFARRRAAVPAQPVQRSGDHHPADLAAPAARALHRPPAHAQGAWHLRARSAAARRSSARPRRRRARWKKRSAREHEWRGYVCMRYWHPMTDAVVRSVQRFAPDRIVLLPLYPQFSTTTTASSFKAWKKAVEFQGADGRDRELSDRARLHPRLGRAGEAGPCRSRRWSPSACCSPPMACRRRSSRRAIPIRRQVEQTAAAIGRASRRRRLVGLLPEPRRPAEMDRARRPRRRSGAPAPTRSGVVLYPLSFVSEHSETLVELDIDYRHLAEQAGVPKYIRVPTVGTHPQFIHGLANLVRAALWSTKS